MKPNEAIGQAFTFSFGPSARKDAWGPTCEGTYAALARSYIPKISRSEPFLAISHTRMCRPKAQDQRFFSLKLLLSCAQEKEAIELVVPFDAAHGDILTPNLQPRPVNSPHTRLEKVVKTCIFSERCKVMFDDGVLAGSGTGISTNVRKACRASTNLTPNDKRNRDTTAFTR